VRARSTILEGCGTGHNLGWLRKRAAVGIDLTWTGLAFARSRGERAVAQATAAQLPFPDAAFDVVTSFDVIYALDDATESAALREMFRVLRPGGCLVINVAAMDLLKGNHSVLANEIRRYSRSTLGARLTERISDSANVLHKCDDSADCAAVRLAQRASGHGSQIRRSDLPAPINGADRRPRPKPDC
jgi:ubiquinone/menaquinone biosynthesis C-methylase UbiE